MKTLLFVTACALTAPALSQTSRIGDNPGLIQQAAATNSISLLDTLIYYDTWNSTTNNWDQGLKYRYDYNSLHKEAGALISSRMNGNAWKDINAHTNYAYDTNHNILEKTHEILYAGSWRQVGKTEFTYDGSNNMLTSLYSSYSSGSWIYSTNLVYTYSNNLITSSTFQIWDNNTQTWNNNLRLFVNYTTNDQITSRVQEIWASGAWRGDLRDINYAYTGGDPTSYETEVWDTLTSMYQPDTKTSQVFDGNHRIQSSLSLKWDMITATWRNYEKADYTYASNGTLFSQHLQTWNTASSVWENSIRREYYYRTGYVGLNEDSQKKQTLQLHPNPCTDELILAVRGNEAGRIRVMDPTGKVVLTGETRGSGSLRLDTRTLKPGMYFVELKNENKSLTGKFIKN